jgi:hypothetical protein
VFRHHEIRFGGQLVVRPIHRSTRGTNQ